MQRRTFASLNILALVLAPAVALAGQAAASSAAKPSATNRVARTPDGKPDL
jgi:hypothetical protein